MLPADQRRALAAAVLLLVTSAGGVAAQAAKGGDGSACGAVAARVEAKSAISGVRAQRAWIAQRHPGSKPVESAITHQGNSIYDRMKIRLASGETVSVCFDITDYFGRY